MPAYTYEALNPQGRAEAGVIEADSERAARNLLRAQGLVPVALQAVTVKPERAGDIVLWQARVFSRTDLVVWTRHSSR